MDFSRVDAGSEYAPFIDEVRSFLDEQFTEDVRLEAEASADQHHAGFFRAVGEKGWIIPELSPEDGGAGLDYWQREILDSEFEARSVPGINISTTRMIFPSVQRFAKPAVRDRVIREVTSGQTALTLGYTEPGGGSDIAEVKTRARRTESGDWVINGSKVYTTGAHHAKYTFLLANSDPEAKKGRGLTMFLLPLDHPGVQVDPIPTLGERTNVTFFGDVQLSDDYRLGEVGGGWAVLQGPLDAEHGLGESAGERAHLDIGILYSRRLAKAIDAAVAWAAGKTLTDIERHDVEQKIGRVALMATLSGSSAQLTGRVAGAENFIEGTNILLDMVGSDAFGDPGSPAAEIHRLHRDAQVSSIYGGTVEVFRNLIARELGLPRPAYRQ